MKYSVRGDIKTSDGSGIISTLNSYTLWRLITQNTTDEQGRATLIFEAWVNNLTDKNGLFTALQPYVDVFTGVIDWHECSHDEAQPQPCIIAETYTR